MLILFEVENFRSIKDPSCLNLTAVNYYKENENQLINEDFPGLTNVKYLRSLALFGPNASGKSSIFQAIETMRSMVLKSVSNTPETSLPYDPYCLDEVSIKNPTKFLVSFVSDGIRYEYEFSFTEELIQEEKLSAYPNGRKQTWFNRSLKKNEDGVLYTDVSGSSSFRVPAALKPLLNKNILLLSLLANYPNFKYAKKIKPIWDWFSDSLIIVRQGPKSDHNYPFSGEIIDGITGTDYQRSFIQNMIRKADVGITSAEVKKESLAHLLNVKEDDPAFQEFVKKENPPTEVKTVQFTHKSGKHEAKIEISNESEGTFQLFTMSGYIAEAIENGLSIFIDEIDASLHPIIVKELIKCFLDPKINKHNAQLIFTAHNPCLLEEGLLRRDQIWFTEKIDGETSLYPLSEYKPRKDETLINGYLAGRYSAIPLVPDCFGNCSECDYND